MSKDFPYSIFETIWAPYTPIWACKNTELLLNIIVILFKCPVTLLCFPYLQSRQWAIILRGQWFDGTDGALKLH